MRRHHPSRGSASKATGCAAQGKRRPGLAVILVGDDPASQVYVRNKRAACERMPASSQCVHDLPALRHADRAAER
ncbi:MAG: hypothetical protein MZW92_29055 [Comamonadaceae bacterium]|nr:hypothetical protein [Comamonadaceae bacterium]